jgi:hypothetical protein
MVRTDEISSIEYRWIDSRKVVLRFDIGVIYWSRNISISIGTLGLAGFGNLGRPYLVSLSGHQLTAASALRNCSREKNTQ